MLPTRVDDKAGNVLPPVRQQEQIYTDDLASYRELPAGQLRIVSGCQRVVAAIMTTSQQHSRCRDQASFLKHVDTAPCASPPEMGGT